MNLVIVPEKLNDLELSDNYQAIIVGLKDFSVHYELLLDHREIEDLIKNYPEKEVFVAINKNIFNDELENLRKALINLSKLNIKAILFYDQAVLHNVKKLKLDLDLVWNQTHMVTNYETINYYQELGVEYAYLASEITLEEILKIREESSSKLMVNLYGRNLMSFSRRLFLSNYYKSINKEKTNDEEIIKHRDETYIVSEEKAGTSLMTSNFINASVLLDYDLDYLIVNKKGMADEALIKLLDYSSSYIKEKDKKYLLKIEELIGNDTGFLFKKTIYKVKQ